MTAIVLRAGGFYGRGLKLIEAARWLMQRQLMAIWQKLNWMHLLALPNFLRIVEMAIEKEAPLCGICNCCDDQPFIAARLS